MRRTAVILSLLLAVCLLAGAAAPEEYRFMPRTLEAFAEPPAPSLSYAGQELSPARGNNDWGQLQPDGSVAHYVACGAHMLENMERDPGAFPRLAMVGSGVEPWLFSLGAACPLAPELLAAAMPAWELPQAQGERISLDWELAPDCLRVQVYDYAGWAARRCGNTEYAELLIADFYLLDRQSLPALPGGGLYVLTASWGAKADPAGGQAEYGFYLGQLK